MRQARVCRGERIRHLKQDLLTYGDWIEATPALLEDYEYIVRAGNEVFGPGTHWIETRDLAQGRAHADEAIETLVADSMQAWVEGDMTRHVGYFTPGAVLITPMGTCHRGHDGLLRAFGQERATMPGLRMEREELQITHASPDTAIVLMEGSLSHSGRSLPERWASTQVAVFTAGHAWRFASQQVFHIR